MPALKRRLGAVLHHPKLMLLAGALRGLWDLFPWTPLGLALSVGAALGLRYFAYAELDMVWLVFGYALLSLLLLAPLLVVPVAVYLRYSVSGQPGALSRRTPSGEESATTLETGVSRATGFSLPSLGFLPLVQVRWTWLSPSADVHTARQGPRVMEHVSVPRRGIHPEVLRRIAVSDAFGLCRIAIRRREHAQVTVLPALMGLSGIAQFSSFASGDDLPNPSGLSEGDRLELRRYAPGDPVRFIHWKLLARTGELVVRTPERALSEAERVAAFFVSGPGDEATAAVARLSLIRGFLGDDFLFATADAARGVSTTAAALDLLARSSGAVSRGADGISSFFDYAAQSGPASFVLFVPPTPGPWLEAVLAAASGRRAHVIIGVDGLRNAAATPLLRRLLFAPPAHSGHDPHGLAAVGQRFAALNCSVAVYDRPAGRLLGSGVGGRAGRAA